MEVHPGLVNRLVLLVQLLKTVDVRMEYIVDVKSPKVPCPEFLPGLTWTHLEVIKQDIVNKFVQCIS